jgi:pimeloyl-ACP methyl ester carboxylesterase
MNWGFTFRGETHSLDAAARAKLGGTYLQLPEGLTHYEAGGPESGRPVVLVHGFSVPYFIWDPTFKALVEAGRRVVRYDLFGRGFSDRPHAAYGLEFFVGQLSGLLDGFGIQQADVIGLSMGGPIAAAFTVSRPGRVRRLILIDPIGPHAMPLRPLYRALLVPGLGELLLGLIGTERMVRGAASDFYDPTHVGAFQEHYREQMQFRGFKRAVLSTLRNKMVAGAPQVYRELGRLSTPVLLVWGESDRTIPFEESRSLLTLLPHAEFRPIPDAGHIPHYERPEIVNPLILNFLGAP